MLEGKVFIRELCSINRFTTSSVVVGKIASLLEIEIKYLIENPNKKIQTME
jgi:hypothetical protein